MNTSLQKAVDLIDLRRSILVLGSGYSKMAKNGLGQDFMLASDLAAHLAALLDEDTSTDLETISGYFIDERENGRSDLLKILKEQFVCTEFSQAQTDIATAPWKRIYTTNYDDIIETIHKTGNLKLETFTRTDSTTGLSRNKACVHLNGYINKVSVENFDQEILLTDVQYLTNELRTSEWARTLRSDFYIARSIFFVGYSMYDFDVAKILTESGITKNIFFIQHEKLGRPQKMKLERFGEVHAIGVEEFAKMLKTRSRDVDEALSIGFLSNFREVLPAEKGPIQPRVEDSFDLLVKGKVKREAISWDISNSSEIYRINREKMEYVQSFISDEGVSVLIHSDIGNGKKIFIEELIERSLQLQYRCFRFDGISNDISDDLTYLSHISKSSKIAVLVPDYYSHENMIDTIRETLPKALIITSSSSAANELHHSKPKLMDTNYYEIDLNRLSDEEIESLDKLLSQLGFWGEKAGFSPQNRQDFIKNRCGRRFRSVILFLFNQPSIKNQIQKIFNQAKEDGAVSYSNFIQFLAMNASGHDPSFREISEIIGTEFANQVFKGGYNWMAEFIDGDDGKSLSISSVFAQYLLREFVGDREIIDEVVSLVRKLNTAARGNILFSKIKTFPLRFSYIERLFGQSNKREKLVNFYETVRQDGIATDNPHFWLQYAIARMSFRDYELAEEYFETSFSIAKTIPGYSPEQIENHYARFLLESVCEDQDAESPFDVFVKANIIVLRQMAKKISTHHSYRVAARYLDFIDTKNSKMSEEEVSEFIDACESVLEFCRRVKPELSSNRYVKDCKIRVARAKEFAIEVLNEF